MSSFIARWTSRVSLATIAPVAEMVFRFGRTALLSHLLIQAVDFR
jgi:hypothetical protein